MVFRLSCMAAALCAVLIAPVLAADAFAVSPQQIQNLGIRLLPLAPSPAGVLSVSYPARVVLSPDQEQVVSSPLAALVTRVQVQDGQSVKAGQPLLTLQSPELSTLQLALVQATSRAKLAGAAWQREKELFDNGITPQRRLLEADAAKQEAQAGLIQARTALQLAGMAEVAIRRLEAGGAPAPELMIGAPAAGVVNGMAIRPGQRVQAAEALLHLVRPTPVWIEIQLPLAVANRYKPGMAVLVGTQPATLVSISPVAGGGQSVSARARLTTSPTTPLLPGTALEARLPSTGGAWRLPQAAVTRQGSQAYVFVRSRDGFTARPVTVNVAAGDQVRVEGSLQAGDQVAVSNIIALKGVWLGDSGMEEE